MTSRITTVVFSCVLLINLSIYSNIKEYQDFKKTVITSKQIHTMPVVTTIELFRYLISTRMININPDLGPQKIKLVGTSYNDVRIMINGIVIDNTALGWQSLDVIPLQSISQIIISEKNTYLGYKTTINFITLPKLPEQKYITKSNYVQSFNSSTDRNIFVGFGKGEDKVPFSDELKHRYYLSYNVNSHNAADSDYYNNTKCYQYNHTFSFKDISANLLINQNENYKYTNILKKDSNFIVNNNPVLYKTNLTSSLSAKYRLSDNNTFGLKYDYSRYRSLEDLDTDIYLKNSIIKKYSAKYIYLTNKIKCEFDVFNTHYELTYLHPYLKKTYNFTGVNTDIKYRLIQSLCLYANLGNVYKKNSNIIWNYSIGTHYYLNANTEFNLSYYLNRNYPNEIENILNSYLEDINKKGIDINVKYKTKSLYQGEIYYNLAYIDNSVYYETLEVIPVYLESLNLKTSDVGIKNRFNLLDMFKINLDVNYQDDYFNIEHRKTLPYTPHTKGVLGVEYYDSFFADDLKLNVKWNYFLSSKKYADFQNEIRIPKYNHQDVMITIKFIDLYFDFIIHNITQSEIYYSDVYKSSVRKYYMRLRLDFIN